MQPWDVVYSVSDLHIGGEPGFQIFTQGELLKATCIALANQAQSGKRVALVVNGDIVDFLAETRQKGFYFYADGAEKRLKEITERPEFAPVFDGWQALIAAGGTIVFTIGNHDIELALPRCKDFLMQRLTNGDVAAESRVIWALDGAGYKCQVGGASVYFVHGNDWDSWNLVDHAALRGAAETQSKGQTPAPVAPNPGTRLVIDVMNPMKNDYRFIDMLKPEGAALAALLAAVDPNNLSNIGGFIKTGVLRLWEKIKRPWLLGGDGVAENRGFGGQGRNGSGMEREVTVSDEEAALRLISMVATEQSKGMRAAGMDVLLQVEMDYRNGKRALDYSSSVGEGDELLSGDAGVSALRTLLWALLSNDRTFQIKDEKDEYFGAACRFVSGVDFVVVGHTHLRRAMQMPSGSAYFNSGTWIDLVAVPNEVLINNSSTEELLARLRTNALDQYKKKLPTVVAIENTDSGPIGYLIEPELTGNKALLKPIEGSSLSPIRRQP